jgi:signal transduction histidine kinase
MDSKEERAPGLVLVVDDNSINRYMLSQHVTQMGHRAVMAGNGREALDKLHGERFDLVLLDIMMPEMDGNEVLAQMKGDEGLRDIPVIMVSGVDELKSVVSCIEHGAEDYLPKPFDPVLLRARIGACLEKKKLRDLEKSKTEELERTLQKLKVTQDQLVVQEKLASLGALTAGIAHEIKNPLNFVNNFSQLSVELVQELREELGKEQAKLDPGVRDNVEDVLQNLEQNVAKINEHGKRADSIVRGMLLHSRGGKAERQATDFNALVKEYVHLAYHGLRGQDTSFQVALDLDFDPSIGSIQIVPQDLSRVILNIANNACYAANAKKETAGPGFEPRISVRTRNLGDKVELRIRDNGNGVPAAIREKIFAPFFTTKPTGSGTGRGLSISYDIVVQGHQGELRLETEEGQFAEFTITLPKQV